MSVATALNNTAYAAGILCITSAVAFGGGVSIDNVGISHNVVIQAMPMLAQSLVILGTGETVKTCLPFWEPR